MKLVFVHGWASGPFIWNEMIDAFQDHECHMVNLGFFGEQNLTVPEGKFIGIGHSLGGSWLLKHHADDMVGFIPIASFSCFYKYVPKQMLAKMQRNIAKDMMRELQDFWDHAGKSPEGGFKNLNSLKLIEGLKWLSTWKSDIPESLPVKSLAAKDDQIVPHKMSVANWENYNLDLIDQGGHMLPLTQPQWCIDHIKSFIDDIK